MNVSAVAATVVVKAPEVPVFKAPDKTPDVQNGAAADGTRTPKPTQCRPAAGTGNADRPAGLTAADLLLRDGRRRKFAGKPRDHDATVNGTRA